MQRQYLLQNERKIRGLSQREVAEFLDISTDTYQRKEAGISEFKRNEMSKLAKYFKKEVTEIFLF